MARAFTPLYCAIWDSEEFCALSSDAQRTYFMLISQADITACGTLALRLRRWSKTLPDRDKHTLDLGLKELIDLGYILIDDDKEELLVRTFVKWDGGYKHALRKKAVIASAEGIKSHSLRAAMAVELGKLGIATGIRLPSESVLNGTAMPPESARNATEVPSESDSGSTEVPPESQRFQVLTLGDQQGNLEPGTRTENLERGTSAENGATTPTNDFCEKHQPNGTIENCGPCAATRKRREAADAAAVTRRINEVTAAKQAREACTRCDPDGWILDPDDDRPIARCDHQPIGANA